MRRTGRHFSEQDKARLLEKLKAWRHDCVRVMTQAPISSVAYQEAQTLNAAIIQCAVRLTGDPQCMTARLHSVDAPGRQGS